MPDIVINYRYFHRIATIFVINNVALQFFKKCRKFKNLENKN